MKNKLWLGIALAVLCLVVCCAYLVKIIVSSTESPQVTTSSDDLYFVFDSQNIMQSLSQEETGTFVRTSNPRSYYASTQPPIQWSQNDYLKIAESLTHTELGDTFEGWVLNYLFFKVEHCIDAPLGPQYASIELVQIAEFNKDTLFSRSFNIEPRHNIINLRNTTTHPAVESRISSPPMYFGGQEIDLDKLDIPADGALDIVEDNGGKDFRLSMNDECAIHIGLQYSDLEDQEKHWIVKYIAVNSEKVFLVDTRTGTIIK